MAESIDGAEKEAAGDEENEGEGDLGDDQERAGTVLGPTDAGLRRCLTEGGFDRGASARDCGPECGYKRAKEGEGEEHSDGSPAGSGVTEVEFHGEAVREEIQETVGEPEAEE